MPASAEVRAIAAELLLWMILENVDIGDRTKVCAELERIARFAGSHNYTRLVPQWSDQIADAVGNRVVELAVQAQRRLPLNS